MLVSANKKVLEVPVFFHALLFDFDFFLLAFLKIFFRVVVVARRGERDIVIF